jgi:phosphate transport system protein
MAEEAKHIVTSFEVDLKKLRDMIAGMGGMVERAVADATEALLEHDPDVAASVVALDPKIDAEEQAIEQFAVRMICGRWSRR